MHLDWPNIAADAGIRGPRSFPHEYSTVCIWPFRKICRSIESLSPQYNIVERCPVLFGLRGR